jgi:hypothetical protein
MSDVRGTQCPRSYKPEIYLLASLLFSWSLTAHTKPAPAECKSKERTKSRWKGRLPADYRAESHSTSFRNDPNTTSQAVRIKLQGLNFHVLLNELEIHLQWLMTIGFQKNFSFVIRMPA